MTKRNKEKDIAYCFACDETYPDIEERCTRCGEKYTIVYLPSYLEKEEQKPSVMPGDIPTEFEDDDFDIYEDIGGEDD